MKNIYKFLIVVLLTTSISLADTKPAAAMSWGDWLIIVGISLLAFGGGGRINRSMNQRFL